MLFPPVHNCDSVEKRRDVNAKDDGELWHETEDAVSPTTTPTLPPSSSTTSGEKRAARNSELYTDDGVARN